jgi:hypothetical protein
VYYKEICQDARSHERQIRMWKIWNSVGSDTNNNCNYLKTSLPFVLWITRNRTNPVKHSVNSTTCFGLIGHRQVDQEYNSMYGVTLCNSDSRNMWRQCHCVRAVLLLVYLLTASGRNVLMNCHWNKQLLCLNWLWFLTHILLTWRMW